MANRLLHAAERVSSIELLFDLVLVFRITQVTVIIVENPTWLGVAQAALTLTVVWWMYDAYAWLTNQAIGEILWLRIGLIAAMSAFLLIAIAIPHAFAGSSLLFGGAYLAVVLIHFTLFVTHGSREAVRGGVPRRAVQCRWGAADRRIRFRDGRRRLGVLRPRRCRIPLVWDH